MKVSVPNVTIYADGGGEKSSATGAGCIIELEENGKLQHTRVVAFMGQATNNEAEISAILMGLAFVQALNKKSVLEAEIARDMQVTAAVDLSRLHSVIKIVSDSEYALKSATMYIFNWLRNGWKTAGKQPVKNQGLWKVYLNFAGKLKITAEHVRGHSGHTFNEACDDASTWARMNGEEALDSFYAALSAEARPTFVETTAGKNAKADNHVQIHGNPAGSDWILIDLRHFLDLARNEDSNGATSELRGIMGEIL